MFKNYFVIALRNIQRNKLFSLLNIAGLALGIVSCLLLYIFVQDELSFDAHHKKADQLYRIQCFYKFEDVEDKFGISPFPVMPTLKKEYPEITDGTRLFILGGQNIHKDDKVINLANAYFADVNYFTLFDYKFIKGNPANALAEPGNVVLTKEYATKIFGDKDPMGQMIEWNKKSLKVTGLIDEKGYNTHTEVGMFIPVTNMNPDFKKNVEANWGNNNSFSYVVIPNPEIAKNFQPKMDDYVKKYILPEWKKFGFNGKITFHIEPLRDIHFNNYLIYDSPKKGNYGYVKLFSIVAILILTIACINYINMSTAAATKRSKEVAMRKVSGASRKQLVMQFMGESTLISFIALLFSFGLLEVFLPMFNEITGKEITIASVLSVNMILVVLGLLFVIGIVAGSFPAFYLSRFSPHLILKNSFLKNGNKHTVRRVLMTVQFAISLFMIISTLMVYTQLNFMRKKEMGFERENMMAITIPQSFGDTLLVKKFRTLKNELKKQSFVSDASFTAYLPGQNFSRFVLKVKTKNGMEDKPIATMVSDYDFPKLMNMELAEGRYFDPKNNSDLNNAVIINEATARMLGWKNPLKESLYIPDDSANIELKVIGVLKDFHFASLHSPIEPLTVFMNDPRFTSGYMMVKMKPGNMSANIASIQKTWSTMLPNKEFEYEFLDDSIYKLYLAEEKMFKVFVYFATLALLLSAMGIYGLSFFSTQQRTKEIGIRKVMGASAGRILILLNKEFVVMIGIALLIAFPAAWYIIGNWLEGFAYHTSLSPFVFIISVVSILMLTVLTVSLQALRTAWRNPVLSLRYE